MAAHHRVVYPDEMRQDPEYLKNQSRRRHADYRWNRAYQNAVTALFVVIFGTLSVAALVDRLAGMEWGLAPHLWASVGFVAFVLGAWIVHRMIAKLILAYTRHTYGPDPGEKP